MLTHLTLTHFRNHAALELALGAGFVVITGENGLGKTNILEAVSLLGPGRGLRGAPLSEMVRQSGVLEHAHSRTGFSIHAQLQPPEGAPLALGTGTLPDAPERRIVRINGAPASANGLTEWLSLVWLTPAMDRLFSESAGGRRRFLDRLTLALFPSHAHHSTRYEAAMRQRNRLLNEDTATDPVWLTSLEAQMALHGQALQANRVAMLQGLQEALEAQEASAFARAYVALEGLVEDDFAGQLAATRARDAAASRTLLGPHRADLLVRHVAKNQPAALCSTGEQKALLIGIILAHAELVAARKCQRPLLLLDEVAAHLDARRRAALFAQLEAHGAQVWMTGTEASLFAEVGSGATHIALRG
jgi:DNA replication and repair protein RecF